MNEQTRKDMQQKMAGYRQKSPDISWETLETALAANKGAVAPNQTPKTLLTWSKRLAVAAVVLLLIGMGWQMMKQDTTVSHEPIATHKNTIGTTNNMHPQPVIAQASPLVTSDAVSSASPSLHHQATSLDTPTEDTVDAQREEQTDTPEQPSTEPQTDTPPSNHQQHVVVTYPSDWHHQSQHPDNKLTAKAYLSNSLAGSNSSRISTPMMLAGKPYGFYHYEMNDYINETLNNQQAEIEENIHHHQPIRLGLSLRYQLNNKWSIEGGLSYTYLASDITQKMNSSAYSIEQKLHYVGVPVNVNYELWTSRRFNIYASVGTIVEKMVKGEQDIQAFHDNQATANYTERVSIRPLQFSMTGSAGAELKLDKSFSIYVEPGLVYHIDNHSSVSTFYQYRPLGFNLNMGLRFKLNNLKNRETGL